MIRISIRRRQPLSDHKGNKHSPNTVPHRCWRCCMRCLKRRTWTRAVNSNSPNSPSLCRGSPRQRSHRHVFLLESIWLADITSLRRLDAEGKRFAPRFLRCEPQPQTKRQIALTFGCNPRCGHSKNMHCGPRRMQGVTW